MEKEYTNFNYTAFNYKGLSSAAFNININININIAGLTLNYLYVTWAYCILISPIYT